MTTVELRALDAEIERLFGVSGATESIAAAWLVVGKLTEGEYVMVRCEESHYHGAYCAVFAAGESQRDSTSLVQRDALAVWGETMAEAICKAALKAVGQ